MTRHRFRFFGTPEPTGTSWIFDQEEAYHAKKILRLEVGDEIEFFDGKSLYGTAEISCLEQSSMRAIVKEILTDQQKYCVMAIVPYLKGQDGVSQYLSSLVELGVQSIHVYISDGDPRQLSDHQKIRLQKIQREACKQSKRVQECSIFYYDDLNQAVRAVKAMVSEDFLFCLSPDGRSIRALDSDIFGSIARGYVVGSEKGFSEKEEQVVQTLPKICLGSLTLRAYTAIISGAAWLC